MLPNFKLLYNNKSDTLDVIFHGSSQGMESRFINKIFEASVKYGHTPLSLNFPFIDKGETKSSGPELLEECNVINDTLELLKPITFSKIRLIGKSLGGVIAGKYVSRLTNKKLDNISLFIMGYDIGYIDIKNFPGEITIIQGSKDKYGDIEAVKKDMKDAKSKNITYKSINGANHSYCNPETEEPIFEDEAIRLIFEK